MKIFIIFTCLVTLAIAVTDEKNVQFEEFKSKFGKIYTSSIEEEFRLKIFLNNLKIIDDHNRLYEQGKTSFDLAINQFADLTSLEFASKFNRFRRSVNSATKREAFRAGLKAAPDSIDWRDYGYVTQIKDEGQCGSAWAFAATGTLEGLHAAVYGQLVSLSEANLMDCVNGNLGCNGGTIEQAYDYVIANGIDSTYPCVATNETCKYGTACNAFAEIPVTGYTNVTSKDEDALKEAVGTLYPVATAIDASHASMQLYNSGVYDEPLCMQDVLDHGVTIVGYGTERGTDYWLVKNSWGIAWGEQGYIKMSRNKNNQCGIATDATYPTMG